MLNTAESRRLFAIISLVIMLLPVMFSGIVPRAHAVTWSPATEVPISNIGLQIFPSMAEDGLGRLWLIWGYVDNSGITVKPGDVYLKIYNYFTGWGLDEAVVTDPAEDRTPSLIHLQNDSMMIAWASNRGGNFDIYTKMNTQGIWAPDAQVTINTLDDTNPSIMQDSTGKLWLFWERLLPGTTQQQDLFYKTYNGTAWGLEQQLTTDPGYDSNPSATSMKDGRVWLAWTSTRTGAANVFYKVYNGTVWTIDTRLTNNRNAESNPAIMQDRDGTIWVFWSRQINVPPPTDIEGDLYYKTSTDNGATWSSDVLFTANSSTFQDFSPSVTQVNDKKIWVFWSSDMPDNTMYNIFYENSSPISTHDVAVKGITVSPNPAAYLDMVSVNVTIADLGDFQETVTLKVMLNSTVLVGSASFVLLQGQLQTVNYQWQYKNATKTNPNATWVRPGYNYLKASLNSVVGESIGNQGDNSMSIKETLLPPGDVTRDGQVNITDIAIITKAWKSTPGSTNWNPIADINHDGIVNITDIAIATKWWKYKI